MNQKIRGWEPDRSAPVGISSLQLDCSFSGLVSHGATLELEGMLLVIFRQAANTVWRKKFGGVPDAFEEALELVGVGDGENIALLAVADRVTGIAYKIGTVLDKPLHVSQEAGMGGEFVAFEDLDGVERD